MKAFFGIILYLYFAFIQLFPASTSAVPEKPLDSVNGGDALNKSSWIKSTVSVYKKSLKNYFITQGIAALSILQLPLSRKR